MSQRFESIEDVIKRNNLSSAPLSQEAIIHHAKKAMVTNSLAYILTDAAESFMLDCENALNRFDRSLKKEVKQNFRQLHRCVHAARLAANKAAKPMYQTGSGFLDDACIDSDWFYHFLQLLDDRVGTNPQKTQLLLEFLLSMPSEGENIFNVKLEDFMNDSYGTLQTK